jgi:hypothetical protein
MLETARPRTRATSASRSPSRRFTWGIVDVILGVVMLPFGIWMLLIQGMVNGITWLFDR